MPQEKQKPVSSLIQSEEDLRNILEEPKTETLQKPTPQSGDPVIKDMSELAEVVGYGQGERRALGMPVKQDTLQQGQAVADAELQKAKEAEQSMVMEVLTGIPAGLTSSIEMYGRAGRTLGIPGSDSLVEIGQKLGAPFESTREGLVPEALHGGVQSTVQSIAAGLPGAGVGAVAGGGLGAIPGFALSAGTIFSLAEYDQFMEEVENTVLAKGGTVEDVRRIQDEMRDKALISSLAEGGFEAVSDLLQAKIFNLVGGKAITKAAKNGLTDALVKFFKGTGKTIPVELGTELATTATQVEARERAGLPTAGQAESLKRTVGPVIVQSLLRGAGGTALSKAQERALRESEEAPITEQERREKEQQPDFDIEQEAAQTEQETQAPAEEAVELTEEQRIAAEAIAEIEQELGIEVPETPTERISPETQTTTPPEQETARTEAVQGEIQPSEEAIEPTQQQITEALQPLANYAQKFETPEEFRDNIQKISRQGEKLTKEEQSLREIITSRPLESTDALQDFSEQFGDFNTEFKAFFNKAKGGEQLAEETPEAPQAEEAEGRVLGEAPAAVRNIPGPITKEAFEREHAEVLRQRGQTEEQIQKANELWERRANRWSEQTGRPVEEYYETRLAGVRAGKSEDVTEANIQQTLQQKAPKTEAGDFVVYHNLTAENLKASQQLGALPAPSLAVTQKDIPFEKYGEISLIADKNLIDPETQSSIDLFSADVYSPNVPRKAKAKRAVDLSEFKAAVVPRNIDPETEKILRDKGLEIVKYRGRGDRPGAIQRYLQKRPELLFQEQQAPVASQYVKPAPPFYSRLKRTIEQKMPNRADAQTVRGIIKDMKKEERAWSGIDEFLERNPKPTKQEVLEHLEQNRIRIEPVVKGETDITNAPTEEEIRDTAQQRYDEHIEKLIEIESETFADRIDELERMRGEADALGLDVDPINKQLSELNIRDRDEIAKDVDFDEFLDQAREELIDEWHEESETKFSEYQLPGGDNYREILLRVNLPKETGAESFVDPHFSETEGVIAHARVNERKTADGDDVLLLEEIQSGLHQKGREQGYAVPSWQVEYLGDTLGIFNSRKAAEEFIEQGTHRELIKDMTDQPISEEDVRIVRGRDQGVPDAPFKNTWHEMTFRRMVREAVEKGKDGIAWTTGEQQIDRYEKALRQNVSRISWERKENQGKVVKTEGPQPITMNVHPTTGEVMDAKITGGDRAPVEDIIGKSVDDVVGKEIGSQIVEQSNGDLSGDGLSVGGEGMKGFYDKILVNYANKFGKKFGVRVKKVQVVPQHEDELSKKSFENALRDAERRGNKAFVERQAPTVHFLPITEKMRRTALQEGFPLFQSGARPRGAVEFLDDQRALIHHFETSNFSTTVHEAAHVFRRDLYRMRDEVLPEFRDQLEQDIQAIEDWLDNQDGGPLTQAQEEKFARGFERYLSEGKAPNSQLRDLFERIKQWMMDIYRNVRDLDVEINDDVRRAFDNLLGGRTPEGKMLGDFTKPTKRQARRRTGLAEEATINSKGELVVGGQVLFQEGDTWQFENEDLRAEIVPNNQGGFNVAFRDKDSGEVLPTVRNFDDVNDAIKYAKNQLGIKTIRPKPTKTKGKPQERLDLGTQAQVPKGKIKTKPFKTEGTLFEGTQKGDQLDLLFQKESEEANKLNNIGDVAQKISDRLKKPQIPRLTNRGVKDHPQIKEVQKAISWIVKSRPDMMENVDEIRIIPENRWERLVKDKRCAKGDACFQKRSDGRGIISVRIPFQKSKNAREFTALLGHELQNSIDLKDIPDLGDVGIVDRFLFERRARQTESQMRQQAGQVLFQYSFENPQIEQEYREAHGIKKSGFLQKLAEGRERFWKNLTRGRFPELPRKQFGDLRFKLGRLAKAKGIAGDKTIGVLRQITKGLDKESYNLFERAILLRDLQEEVKAGNPLPGFWTEEAVNKEARRIQDHLKNNQEVVAAIALRKRLWNVLTSKYTDAMKVIGLDVESRFTREDYFRHQVLEHAIIPKVTGTGKKLKTPSYRGFLKRRKGKALTDEDTGRRQSINTDYLQAEFEVMTQMIYDIDTAKVINLVDRDYNIAEEVRKQAREKQKETGQSVNWENEIPDTHTMWQPREGNVFYFASSIPESKARLLLEDQLESMEISKEDIRKVLSVGGPRKRFVIPNEVAAQLNELVKEKPKHKGLVAWAGALRGWKVWQLISPRRYFKYNARNITGDADAAFAGNPKVFKKVPEAVKDLGNVFWRDKKLEGDLKDWFNRGGMGSILQSQEIGEINQLKQFEKLVNKRKTLTDKLNVAKHWFSLARTSTDFREAILRYAAYLQFLDEIKANNGKVKNYAASIPYEVDQIKNVKDKAFQLSNDLLGAYDDVSVIGQELRERWIPFWSWKEVNAKRYVRLMKNAAQDGVLAATVGRKLVGTVARSPLIALRVGSFALKVAAFSTLMQAWNETFFDDEEDDLPEGIKRRPHLIFGRDENGEVIYFDRLGAIGDFLEWFGLGDAPYMVMDYLNGRKSLKEIATEMAKSPVNIFAQGLRPELKITAELASGKSYFPDVFEPRTIRDKGFHVIRGLGLGNEYRAITNLPSRPYKDSFRELFIYDMDPGQSAMIDIYDEKQRFLKEIGEFSTFGGTYSPRSNALYNYKLALRYKDKEAAERYLNEYVKLGGTGNGLKRSLQSLHPLSGLNQSERTRFYNFLDAEGRRKLKLATEFYMEVISGGQSKDTVTEK